MDLSNAYNAIVVGTGDLSELALGWCTYNGDHMSMYAVNASVPKTLVRYIVESVALKDEVLHDVLMDICDTPVSPELLPPDKNGKIAQKTEEVKGVLAKMEQDSIHLVSVDYKIDNGFRPF